MKLVPGMKILPPLESMEDVIWKKRNELAQEYAKLLISRPEPLRSEEVARVSFAIADAMVDRMYEQ